MTEYKDLADSLNKNSEGIPRARRFRANFETIEKFLDTGITAKYLVKCLNENGFDISIDNFNIELYRARNYFKKQGGTKTDIKSNSIKKSDTITEQQNIEEKENQEEDEREDENLTPKQKRERTANKYIGGASNNPFIKNTPKG